MKYATLLIVWCALLLPGLGITPAAAQTSPFKGSFNPYAVQFRRAWDYTLPDPVKLIDLGQTNTEKKQKLLLLGIGKNAADPKRKLVVTHWDGFRFSEDFSHDFVGSGLDALLVAHFRTAPPAVQPAGTRPGPPSQWQIATGEGIYEWDGRTYSRLFAAPPEIKLAMMLDKMPDQLVCGVGDGAVAYEIGPKDVHPATAEATDSGGFVRYGVGTQDYAGAEGLLFTGAIRYTQSFWEGNRRWVIGRLPGKAAELKDFPAATTGDRLVVFIPKAGGKDKNFWATHADEMEEAWRGDPLPGRVLDVRVGDPKDENTIGILVLTAENQDKVYRLYYYVALDSNGRTMSR